MFAMTVPTVSSRFFLSLLCAVSALLAVPSLARAAESYSLPQLLQLVESDNRALHAARDAVSAARAAVGSAGAFPNPELEVSQGQSRARLIGAPAGDVRTLTLSQPLEWPQLRGARIDAADAAWRAADAGRRAFEADVHSWVKLRYYELLRRQAEVVAADEDLSLATQIRSRIQLLVDQGEVPRFELIKADTEYLNAQKQAQVAELRVVQARAALRQAVGSGLPETFMVSGSLPRQQSPLPPLAELREKVLANNAELGRNRAETEQAGHQLDLERAKRLPGVALKAGRDTDSELNTSRIGIAITIPLWDRRSGPVGEATAGLARARNEGMAREFSLLQGLENAYLQYQIAANQVQALESGVVHRAEAAQQVAAAAYRHGERGILDYLDAQRVYRAARNELIAARYELAAAVVEIDRLRGATDVAQEKP